MSWQSSPLFYFFQYAEPVMAGFGGLQGLLAPADFATSTFSPRAPTTDPTVRAMALSIGYMFLVFAVSMALVLRSRCVLAPLRCAMWLPVRPALTSAVPRNHTAVLGLMLASLLGDGLHIGVFARFYAAEGYFDMAYVNMGISVGICVLRLLFIRKLWGERAPAKQRTA